ncbi:hypothetical protein ACFSCW_03610 [Sphingomonas tabacisoli]|uniref:Uncharacterized protein n=1 Tax=Sphingomonas tabacisoli TaxID=2249466 RepID=A0ABW4HZ50_9SPHN
MNRLMTMAVLGATLSGTAASAQVIDPQTSRDLGRAVGQAAVAAQQAAEEAKIAARQAMRAARQGFAEGATGAERGGGYARPAMIGTEDDAVDACAMAAEQRGYDQGVRAVVRDIQGVDRRPGGWDVDGVVEARRTWREHPDTWGFRCQVRDGQIVNVDLGRDIAFR